MEDDDVITVTVRNTHDEEPRSTRPPKRDPTITEGLVPISEAHWNVILKLYLRTYRGPNAVADLKSQLQDYQVLRKTGHVGKGRYVRYLPRGLVDVDLKRGGWVVKCNTSSVHLQDGRRQWRVLRRDNFIFIRSEDGAQHNARYQRKGILRLLAEEALSQDTRHRATSNARDARDTGPPLPPLKLKANFM